MLRDLLLSVVNALIRLVLEVNCLTALSIFFLGGLGITYHLVDLSVREATGRAHSDGLSLASRLILGGYVQNTIGIDVKSNLDLRDTARSHRDATEFEVT